MDLCRAGAVVAMFAVHVTARGPVVPWTMWLTLATSAFGIASVVAQRSHARTRLSGYLALGMAAVALAEVVVFVVMRAA
jgi:hypothetical protein